MAVSGTQMIRRWGSCSYSKTPLFCGLHVLEDFESSWQLCIAGEEPGRDSVLTEALAGYLANILTASDAEEKLAAVWCVTCLAFTSQ